MSDPPSGEVPFQLWARAKAAEFAAHLRGFLPGDYLFLPRPMLSDGTAMFVDVDGATYQQFENTFGVLWRSSSW